MIFDGECDAAKKKSTDLRESVLFYFRLNAGTAQGPSPTMIWWFVGATPCGRPLLERVCYSPNV